MLLAGLIDAGGPRAFGHVTAETPEEARAAVQRYHAAGFEQIKLYTFLTPEIVKVIADEAHSLGMTVTGHVPMALTTKAGIEAGMDQINHLNYATSLLRAAPARSVRPTHGRRREAGHSVSARPPYGRRSDVELGRDGSHSKEIPLESFEPGILTAPAILDAKFRGMEGNATADQQHARMAQSGAVIMALFARACRSCRARTRGSSGGGCTASSRSTSTPA